MEKITHSLCTLEFADHRPLYDWVLDTLQTPCHPHQIEFARLNLNFTVMSKRKLMQMVNEKRVGGWDDPRMLTISGLRRRGYTPASIRNFCAEIGLAKRESRIDMGILENAIRNDLNDIAPRRQAVLKPLKVVISNYPEEKEEELEIGNHPKDPNMGTRMIPFCREIYIDHDDFMEEPPKKFFRLSPGSEVRLRAAYFITCDEVIKDKSGAVVELRCSYDPASRGGSSPDGRKVKGTLHWVSARHALDGEIRLYDRLFNKENPEDDPDVDFKENINPESLQILPHCKLEPSLLEATVHDYFQFERVGFFKLDSKESAPGKPVFNRTVTLRDTWAKLSDK
jgi:glutaminyl-tRNA synthetase